MDHVGMVPELYRRGFQGRVWCTRNWPWSRQPCGMDGAVPLGPQGAARHVTQGPPNHGAGHALGRRP
jgi:hypothetical protein